MTRLIVVQHRNQHVHGRLAGEVVALGAGVTAYKVGDKDTITFKNSPLLQQTDGRAGREFKNTKKFLRRANNGDAAISVYQTPNDILVVTGAIRYLVPAENVVMGFAAMAAAGIDPSEIFPQNTQTVYFESLFDGNFNHKQLPQQRLAADYIGQYFAENGKNISLETVFHFREQLVR